LCFCSHPTLKLPSSAHPTHTNSNTRQKKPGTTDVVAGQMGFVVLIGTVVATQPALMVEVTPYALRCTTIALGYNICVGVLGGLTPLAATWLVYRTDMDLSPAFMAMAVAALSFVATLSFRTVAKA